jgi:hypothetical protein
MLITLQFAVLFIAKINLFVQDNDFSETVENLFSAGLMNENQFKTYMLQHWDCIGYEQ